MPAVKKSEALPKWDDRHYVTAYSLAAAGHTDEQIAGHFDVTDRSLYNWMKRKPALRDAIDRGRKLHGDGGLKSHIYGILPENLQELWDRIDMAGDIPGGHHRTTTILAEESDAVKQRLFLHALSSTNFDLSQACKKLHVSKAVLDRWQKENTEFAELMEEVLWHKGNFYEKSYIDLVAQGSEAATIHAAKTYNKARGYGDSKTIDKNVNHAGTVKVEQTFSLEDLELDEDTACKLLDAVQALQAKKNAPQLSQNQSLVEKLPYGLKQLPSPDRVGSPLQEG